MKRRALVLSILATLALTPLSANAAVKKIPVTVEFTAIDDEGGLVGVLDSPSAKCVAGKDVYDRYPNQRISTNTNGSGEFTVSTGFLSEINFESFDATVAKGPKFGKKGKKKQCQSDSAHVETSPPGTVDVETFTFNEGPNTFSGTLDSNTAECADPASLDLYRYVAPDFFLDRTFTSAAGAFNYAYGSQPQSGFWQLESSRFIGENTFGPDGAISVTYCEPGAFASTEVP